MPTIQHWYTIPDKTVAKALKNGFARCPTEIALRPQDGTALSLALEITAKTKSVDFATRKVISTLCGVNYDPKRDPAKRQEVSRASENPELFPDYLFGVLPAQVVTMLLAAFADINDPDEDEVADFRKSHSAVS